MPANALPVVTARLSNTGLTANGLKNFLLDGTNTLDMSTLFSGSDSDGTVTSYRFFDTNGMANGHLEYDNGT